MTRSWPIREPLTAKLKSLLEKRGRRGEDGRGRRVCVADRQVKALNISKRTKAVNVYEVQSRYEKKEDSAQELEDRRDKTADYE
jgi:hypothetical protein